MKSSSKKIIIIFASVLVAAAVVLLALIQIKGDEFFGKKPTDFEQAEKYYSVGKYETAMELYRASIDNGEMVRESKLKLADIYVCVNDIKQARMILEDTTLGITAADAEVVYSLADIYYKEGDYDEVYNFLTSYDESVLNGYSKKADIEPSVEMVATMNDKIISFGHYPQNLASEENATILDTLKPDENGIITKFGKRYIKYSDSYFSYEPINWIILNETDEGYLVMSERAIEQSEYGIVLEDTTWENSIVRKFLNDEFLNTAFNELEQSFIVTQTWQPSTNIGYNNSYTEVTEEKVSILSAEHASDGTYIFNLDFKTMDPLRVADATDYAVKKGVYVSNIDGGCKWWLRTPGYNFTNVMYVSENGRISSSGAMNNNNSVGTRPVIFIDKKAFEVENK